jgi:TRAP transporter TAXI family solute receptor
MRDVLKVYVPIAGLVLVGFAVAYHFVDPAPPRHIRIATGAATGFYAESAARYRDILARDGITLEIVGTSGSMENLGLLQATSGGVDVAFLQGGTVPAETRGLVSLASVFLEPLWVFVRAEQPVERLADLKGRRAAVGPPGSGTRVLALQLLEASGVGPGTARLLDIGGDDAVRGLLAGELDAAFFVTAKPMPALEPLLRAEGVRLMSFRQAEGSARRFRFLSPTVLHQGVLDLAANIPTRDVRLLAPAAALVARESLHPAIQDRLLEAAIEAHAPGQFWGTPGMFPSTRYLDIPISEEAARHLKSGPTFLRRHLPFWVAILIERFLVMLVPLLTLLLPLSRLAPPLYTWRVRRRIYRWYKDLRRIEEQATGVASAEDRARLLAELEALQREIRPLHIPLSYSESHYNLRLHVNFVRQLLEGGAGPAGDSASNVVRARAGPPA